MATTKTKLFAGTIEQKNKIAALGSGNLNSFSDWMKAAILRLAVWGLLAPDAAIWLIRRGK